MAVQHFSKIFPAIATRVRHDRRRGFAGVGPGLSEAQVRSVGDDHDQRQGGRRRAAHQIDDVHRRRVAEGNDRHGRRHAQGDVHEKRFQARRRPDHHQLGMQDRRLERRVPRRHDAGGRYGLQDRDLVVVQPAVHGDEGFADNTGRQVRRPLPRRHGSRRLHHSRWSEDQHQGHRDGKASMPPAQPARPAKVPQ